MYISNDKDYTKATKLWKWNINGLAYSNDGGETFGLAITMDGAIVADFITAGILNADLIKTGKLQDIDGNIIFDLSTGTLTFKKGSININNGAFKVDTDGTLTATKGYFSGDVVMGPNSVITWGNLPDGVAAIDDIPTSPGDIGALPASDLPSYITKTKITQTTIESPDIRGGEISSDTVINVGTDATIGKYLYMKPEYSGGIKWNGVAEIYVDPGGSTLVVTGLNNTQIGHYRGNTIIRGNVSFPDSDGITAVFG